MAKIVSLTCQMCGARLEISSDVDRFACTYCGTMHMVERSGGEVDYELVRDLANLRQGVDRNAAELAIPRLKSSLGALKGEQARLMAEIEQSRANLREPVRKNTGWTYMKEKALRWIVAAILMGIIYFFIISLLGDNPFNFMPKFAISFVFGMFAIIAAVQIGKGLIYVKEDLEDYQDDLLDYEDELDEADELEEQLSPRIAELQEKIDQLERQLKQNLEVADKVIAPG